MERAGQGRLGKTRREAVDGGDIPAFLVVVSLLVELARTAVAFFNTDLLFAVALLGTRRLLGRRSAGDGDRGVLSFRSGLGLLLLGLLDLDLLGGGCGLGGGLGFALLVGRGEDAEGDGNASLKVQIGDL